MTILTTVFNTFLVQGPPDVSIGRKLFNRADASELLEESVDNGKPSDYVKFQFALMRVSSSRVKLNFLRQQAGLGFNSR